MRVPPDSNHGAGWLPGDFMTNNYADSSTRWLVNCEEDLTAFADYYDANWPRAHVIVAAGSLRGSFGATFLAQ